jgi:hypothetical protein
MPLLPDYGPMPDEFSGKWNHRNLPPEGHADVGPYFYRMFMEALHERTRLEIDKRFDVNYRMFRGNHWGNMLGILTGKSNSRLSLALLSTNIQKTVANICAKAPTIYLKCDDGRNDDADKIMQKQFDVWHNVNEFVRSMQRSTLNMEIYGTTFEKAVYDVQKDRPVTVVCDPYSLLVAPGYYAELNDAPYICHMQGMYVPDAEGFYGVEKLNSDETLFSILGEHREDYRQQIPAMVSQGSGRYGGNYVPAQPISGDNSLRTNRVLVIEIWVRDLRTKGEMRRFGDAQMETPEAVKDAIPLFVPDEGVADVSGANPDVLRTGQESVSELGEQATRPLVTDASDKELYYPGGIRRVVICNSGVVLDDSMNPSINPELPEEYVSKTYLYDHFPFFKANSYEDTTSIWGYSQCELVGDLNLAVDKLWSNLMYHMNMALFPPLILPKDTKVSKAAIRYEPRLVIEPITTASAGGIKFLELPSPPTLVLEILKTLISFFDRISALEDPTSNGATGAISASAIEILQERASLMIQAKIKAVDYLVRQRGRAAISLWQNFGVTYEEFHIDGQLVKLRGVDLIGRKFDYNVESGSTVAKSGSAFQAQCMQLFQLGVVDAEAVLKAVSFPEYQEVLARMSRGAVGQALDVLAQSGIPPEVIAYLQQAIQQIQAQQGVAAQEQAMQQDSAAAFGQQQGQGMQTPGQGKPSGAAPATGAPGGAVGAPGGSPGAPSKPGVPKSQQGRATP